MTTRELREAERAKYELAYVHPNYRMREGRQDASKADLRGVAAHGYYYLDVSCGRGEMLDYAESLDFACVQGTEIVPALIDPYKGVCRAYAHDLPFCDGSFHVVSMFDVIEHLIPGDDEAACRELRRVASKHILITASNKASVHNGHDLHINKRPYDEWERLFKQWFQPFAHITRMPPRKGASEHWRIDL